MGLFPSDGIYYSVSVTPKRYIRVEVRYEYIGTTYPQAWHPSPPQDSITITEQTGSPAGTCTGTHNYGEKYIYKAPGSVYHHYKIITTASVIYKFQNLLDALATAGYDSATYEIVGIDTDFSITDPNAGINVLQLEGTQPAGTEFTGMPKQEILTNNLTEKEIIKTQNRILLTRLIASAFSQGTSTNIHIFSNAVNTDPAYWLYCPGTKYYDITIVAVLQKILDPAGWNEGFNYDVNKPEGTDTTKEPTASRNATNEKSNSASGNGLNTFHGTRYIYPNLYTDEGVFDYLYIPSDIWATVQISPGVVIGLGEISIEDITIERIKNSFVDADEMTFIERVKYDANGSFTEGAKVFGLIYGQTRFVGYIVSKNRFISSNDQYIRYEAVGLRRWLYHLPFAQLYNVKDSNTKSLFEKVLNSVPSFIIADYDTSILPTKNVPDFYTVAANIGPTLDDILDKAGHYAYYIDTTKKLTVYDLKALPSYVELKMSTEGWYLKGHPECKILEKNLSGDISQAVTRAILLGDFTTTVKKVKATATLVPNTVFYIIELNNQILNTIPGRKDTVIIEKIGDYEASPTILPSYIRLSDGTIKGVRNMFATDINSFEVYVTAAFVGSPVKYDTGWVGTAFSLFNIQNVIQRYDTKFKLIKGTTGLDRDDTGAMQLYANSLIEPYKDYAIGGTITLDTLFTTLTIGKAVRLTGTAQAGWTTTDLVVKSITFNVSELTTVVELTSNYFIGSGIVDPRLEEIKEKRTAEQARIDMLRRLGELER